MSTRISKASLTIVLLLGGCGQDAGNPRSAVTGKGQGDVLVPCRVDGASDMQPVCSIEASASDRALLTIRHPDGGFRRFRIVADGPGVVPADGSQQENVTIIADNRIEVTVAGDSYQLPATIAPPGE